ncbi:MULTISPECIES: hypothetical protein [unclassified Rhizobium]|uniref:hypothetical protein n=1 Tax=unclassified Rhizobium TaxID=2613769 RepID=UPI000BE7AE38|nr:MULTISPECIES: hypothetical protein [unclassified Rhizobium]MDF0664158.1 hypothetical protein [Rhizobium sp. BC49]PDS78114.1 hypothetical protein CO654_33565 [Rhizobium sp. L18]
MIPSQIAKVQNVLNDAEVALCQKVYDHVVSVKQISTDAEREDLARQIALKKSVAQELKSRKAG